MATNVSIYCYDVFWDENKNYTIRPEDFDCAQWTHCHCPMITADPDVAGIGVTIAFSVSAGLTLLLTGVCFILSRPDDGRAFNPIDAEFLGPVSKWARRVVGESRADRITLRIRTVVIALSDSQLVTGISILVAALHLAQQDSMDAWHFMIATQLAWLSANAYLLSLLAVRTVWHEEHVKKSGISCRRSKRGNMLLLVRFCLMLCLVTLLVNCFRIVSWGNWRENLSCPVKCIHSAIKPGTISGNKFYSLEYTCSMLLLSCATSMIPSLRCYIRWSRTWLEPTFRWLEGLQETIWHAFFPRICLILSVWWLSNIASMLILTILFISNLIALIRDRQRIQHDKYYYDWAHPVVPKMPIISREEYTKLQRFSFGQLLPIFMLLLPILALLDSCKDGRAGLQSVDTEASSHDAMAAGFLDQHGTWQGN